MNNQRFLDNFILVEYNNLPYPEGYTAQIKEVASHFDKEHINPEGPYSLHTEYSYGKRKFNSTRLANYPALVESHKDGVPQLWKSIEWAKEFADFIIGLTKGYPPPSVIEIHPPFNDYCTLNDFSAYYRVFEESIHNEYPETMIVIENRAGKIYRGGDFWVRKANEICALCDIILEKNLNLGIVLDFPQLLTAENINPFNFNVQKYDAAINSIAMFRNLIKGIHIWGKRKNEKGHMLPHHGNFDTFFNYNNDAKERFLEGIRFICNDNLPRFLVPEVNSNQNDLASIIKDLDARIDV